MNQTSGQLGRGKSFHQFFFSSISDIQHSQKHHCKVIFHCPCQQDKNTHSMLIIFSVTVFLLLLYVYSTNVELCMYITAVIVMLAENTKHIPFASRKPYRFSSKKIIRCNDPPNLPPSHLSVHFELRYGARCFFVLILWLGDQ